MARPNKKGISEREASMIQAFNDVSDGELPKRTDILQETVCALLNRIRRIDEETARRVAVFLKVLTAREAYWAKHRSNMLDGVEASRESSDYRDLLCEIALGGKTKHSHCKESVVDHALLLDLYLTENNGFSTCRNASTRLEWLLKHGPAIIDILSVIPCFCSHSDELITSVPPRWLKSILNHGAGGARLRDAILGLFHGTTAAKIAKVRSQPTAFTSDGHLFRPLSDVIVFPQF